MPEQRFLETMAHIIIPLHQSKVATIVHNIITTAYLADNDNFTVQNFIITIYIITL